MIKTYTDALKAYLVKQFIKENNRAPNELELKELIRNGNKEFADIENIGFSGHLITKPQFGSHSSSSNETENRQALLDDLSMGVERLIDLARELENTSRGLFASTRNISAALSNIESRLDNMLLLSNQTDVFVHGVEENFYVQDKINFDLTTASVEHGFVTIGRNGYGPVDISDVNIKYSTFAEKGYLSVVTNSIVNTLKEDDGNFWEYLVYTSYKTGRVSVAIDVTLSEPQFISEFRFTTQSAGVNSNLIANVFYTLDGNTYKQIEPFEYVVSNSQGIFHIGLDGVKGIRLILSKNQYDTKVSNIGDQYVYVFSLDSIKLYSKGYVQNGESVLYAGPYNIYDELGNAVTFSKATADVCLTKGSLNGVSLYLSANGDEYIPVNIDGNGLAVVTFSDSSDPASAGRLNTSLSDNTILADQYLPLRSNEALINKTIAESYANNYVRKSIVLKRNIPAYDNDGNRIKVYNIDSGWFYNPNTKLYKTTVYITNPAGCSINLGSTSAYVNGALVSGLVKLKQGYSVFETSANNWNPVVSDLRDITSLRKADMLYPYNHKYLIEGYRYVDAFKGERVYNGIGEFFGTLCNYVPPELFVVNTVDVDYNIYTVDHANTYGAFKIKVDKSNATWANEQCEVSWTTNYDGSDRIWFKMILESSIAYSSPIISSVRMRVI